MTFDDKVKADIKYRVEQEYEKYHNETTFEINGKDFWIEQITWKLADTFSNLVLSDVVGSNTLIGESTNTNEAMWFAGRNSLRIEQRLIINGKEGDNE